VGQGQSVLRVSTLPTAFGEKVVIRPVKPEELVGKTIILVANLQPTKLMGVESQGMVLSADGADRFVVATFDQEAKIGSKFVDIFPSLYFLAMGLLLSASKWTGKMVVDTRPKAFVGLIPVWGEQKVLDFVKKLVTYKPQFRRGQTEALQLMAAGEFPCQSDFFHQIGYSPS
jgi:tRNA-binding EMAP/Myf-like protein